MIRRLPVVAQRRYGFVESIEDRARQIVGTPRLARSYEPENLLEQRIALKLAQLDRIREVRSDQERSLLHMECYTNTELMQMEARTPRYSPYRFPEREKIQRRLLDFEKERRKLSLTHHEKVAKLEEDLLTLMQQHGQTSP